MPNDGNVFFADELVDHQGTPHTTRVGNEYLVRGRKRDAPRACLQLPIEQSRGHGGFAVRR